MCYFCDSKDNLFDIMDTIGTYPEYCPICGRDLLSDNRSPRKIYFVQINNQNDYGCVDVMMFDGKKDIVAEDSPLNYIQDYENYDPDGEGESDIFPVYEAAFIGNVKTERVTKLSFM